MADVVKKTLYDNLGVKPDATQSEIKAAYRKLAKIHHPDMGGRVEVFRSITAIYEFLSDPEKRARYDRRLVDEAAAQAARAAAEDMTWEIFINGHRVTMHARKVKIVK